MALDLTPEEKQKGKENFNRAVGQLGAASQPNRRQFMRGLLATGAAVPIAAAAYYGYDSARFGRGGERPVKAAIIGCGDEGGVLVGEHNPQYLEIIAACDIRPYNKSRIINGEPRGPRKGLRYHYGAGAFTPDQVYDDYKRMLEEKPEIEAVIIALPLHLHAPVAIDCMEAGKHVLCEKLMAWNIQQCKQMIQKADEKGVVLAIGHQRHYSLLYAQAVELLNTGILGTVHHIRAQWHRNNVKPLTDHNDPRWNPDDPFAVYRDSWRPGIPPEDRAALGNTDLRPYGFRNLEELVRWRLYGRTGGGLMAELGSHQLDACSIFLGKVRPLAVSATGGKYFYEDDRECEDHVFCTYEFPGKNYWDPANPDRIADPNDIVVVTYSSICTNDFEPYGECVMGTGGTMVVEEEEQAMLYGLGSSAARTGPRSTGVTIAGAASGSPSLDSYGSEPPPAADQQAAARGQSSVHSPPSRGYREEMEHFAYVIRMRPQANEEERARLKPRCDGRAAMADAIMALTANKAIETRRRIEFRPGWYDPRLTERTDENFPNPGVEADTFLGTRNNNG